MRDIHANVAFPNSHWKSPCRACCAVMTDAFKAIWDIHANDGLPLRTSAFVKALQRVTRARIHRGFD